MFIAEVVDGSVQLEVISACELYMMHHTAVLETLLQKQARYCLHIVHLVQSNGVVCILSKYVLWMCCRSVQKHSSSEHSRMFCLQIQRAVVGLGEGIESAMLLRRRVCLAVAKPWCMNSA